MNKRLVAVVLTHPSDFDPIADFPEDIERLVTVATEAGYWLSPSHAAELWWRYSGDVCARWLSVGGNDQDILKALLTHAEIERDVVDMPTPPEGYANWLDFAVDTMVIRAEELERLLTDTSVSRQSMRDAVRAELLALRRRAGDI